MTSGNGHRVGRLVLAFALVAGAGPRRADAAAAPRHAARADSTRPASPAGPGLRTPVPRTERPDPPAAAAPALERSRHLLLDVRPFDFAAWKEELRGVFAAGPAADLWIAAECRRCALVMADQLPADSLLPVIDTGVTLAPALAFDDSLLELCRKFGRQPPAMERERDLAAERNRLRLEVPAPDSDAPPPGGYVAVEELPEAITKAAPEYPDAARQAKIQGTVMLQVLVGKDGRVRDVRIVHSIPALDAAAAEAAKQWVFKPALSKGQPVAVWVGIPIKFTLH